jgi:membrane protease YdiL (CAAX protease family)
MGPERASAGVEVERPLAAGARLALIAEAAFPFAAQQAYVWGAPLDRPRWVDVAFGAAAGAVVLAYVLRRGGTTFRSLGLAPGPEHRMAARPLLLLTLVAVAALLCLGWATTGERHGGLRWKWDLARALALYPFWGLVQQGIVFGVAYPRLERAGGPRFAAAGVASLFALAHLPNPLLSGGGGLMCLAFALVWRRAPSLPATALAHGWIGAVADKALNVPMRVGAKYFS